jgi:hypothetical protein
MIRLKTFFLVGFRPLRLDVPGRDFSGFDGWMKIQRGGFEWHEA